MRGRPIVPVVLLVVSLGAAATFAPRVHLPDLVGLFASGALAGVSALRLLGLRRRSR